MFNNFKKNPQLENKDLQKLEKKNGVSTFTVAEFVSYCNNLSSNSVLSNKESVNLYLATPPIRSAVTLISDLASSLPTIVCERKKEGEIKEEHESLNLLEYPSFAVSNKEFISQACVNYLVTSENFFLLKKSANGTPQEIYNISPIEISIVDIDNFGIKSYKRTVSVVGNANKEILFTRQDIIREKGSAKFQRIYLDKEANQLWPFKEYNPFSTTSGISKISTLDDSANGFNIVGRHNRKLIENGCSPTGILNVKSEMTDEDAKKFQENYTNSFTGESKAGKIQVLQGEGMEYIETHISPREMDWINGRKYDEKIIYDLFGVPQALRNNEASSFNNLSTSMYMFYEFTIFPLLDKIYGELTDLLMPKYENSGELEIYYSKEEIPSLDAIKTESTLNKSKTGIYTVNELRVKNGLEPIEGGDVLHNSSKQSDTQSQEEQTSDSSKKETAEDIYRKENDRMIEELKREGLL